MGGAWTCDLFTAEELNHARYNEMPIRKWPSVDA